MKFFQALLKVGTGIVRETVPGAGILIDTVNQFLPHDKRLPAVATGEQVQDAIATLTPAARMQLMDKEIDLEIQEVKSFENIQKALAVADSTGSSTRPDIAYMMAWCVVGQVVAVIAAIVCAAFGKTEGLTVLKDCWPMLVASIGTPTVLLQRYFGLRTQEKQMRQAVAHGHPPPISPLGIISKLLK